MAELSLLWQLLAWSSLAVVGNWLAPPRWRRWIVAGCGAAMLALLSPWSLLILASAAIGAFLLRMRLRGNAALMVATVTLVVICFIATMWAARHSQSGIEARLVLPLGLAFYCLRLIHYVVDAYLGSQRQHDLGECLAYHFLPSALPVGPIHRLDEFLRDWRRQRWDLDTVLVNAQRVLYGLVKLTILGTYLIGKTLDSRIAELLPAHPYWGGYLELLSFWLKLYLTFAGYSDIAIGFAGMLGLRLRENFNRPFVARNIVDFWQRWHLSLSSWCRDYVFTPVLSLTRMPAVAVVTSMVVLGLWHEPSLRYVLWGLYHGAGIAAFRRFDASTTAVFEAMPARWVAVWRVVATLLTLHFVIFSFRVTHAVEFWLESILK